MDEDPELEIAKQTGVFTNEQFKRTPKSVIIEMFKNYKPVMVTYDNNTEN